MKVIFLPKNDFSFAFCTFISVICYFIFHHQTISSWFKKLYPGVMSHLKMKGRVIFQGEMIEVKSNQRTTLFVRRKEWEENKNIRRHKMPTCPNGHPSNRESTLISCQKSSYIYLHTDRPITIWKKATIADLLPLDTIPINVLVTDTCYKGKIRIWTYWNILFFKVCYY